MAHPLPSLSCVETEALWTPVTPQVTGLWGQPCAASLPGQPRVSTLNTRILVSEGQSPAAAPGTSTPPKL